MQTDCIFCKIIAKEISADLVYEDDSVIALRDINPAAPVHVLVIPKKHIANLLEAAPEDRELYTRIVFDVVPRLARELGVAENGFRLVVNTKVDGGQTVDHLHFHILGGRSMSWPPG